MARIIVLQDDETPDIRTVFNVRFVIKTPDGKFYRELEDTYGIYVAPIYQATTFRYRQDAIDRCRAGDKVFEYYGMLGQEIEEP